MIFDGIVGLRLKTFFLDIVMWLLGGHIEHTYAEDGND